MPDTPLSTTLRAWIDSQNLSKVRAAYKLNVSLTTLSRALAGEIVPVVELGLLRLGYSIPDDRLSAGDAGNG